MMTAQNRIARLLSVLEKHAEDPVALQYLAHALNYNAEELSKDMAALSFRSREDSWSNNAACGYAIAAAQAAGMNHRDTAKLIDAMTAAFDNMTTDEAKAVYEDGDF